MRPAVAASSLPISVVIESLFVLYRSLPKLKEVPDGQGYCLSPELLHSGPQKRTSRKVPNDVSRDHLTDPGSELCIGDVGVVERRLV